ncbi:TPA: alpha-amylase family glycosyl hydrolase [Streptococcus agalactiae]
MTIDKRKVVYQIYPKSYKDTTGNGVGDLRGIIEKLPYLAELGIDMVWLNPFYPSPQRDNGYDISDYLKMLNNASFGQDDSFMTVGEMSSTTIANCILYTAPEREELSMAFNFHHLKVDYKDGQKWTIMAFDFPALRDLFHSWGEGMSEGNGWNALFYNNHDQPRALNRFVDVKRFRNEGATMLAASIHLSRGTPYIYMGEEIGMLDPDYSSMDDYVDIESLNAYQIMLDEGKSQEEAFSIIRAKSRDNSRVPMQWDDSTNAGFSEGAPWLKVGKSYKEINVAKEKTGLIFTFYQELIRLRKQLPIIADGNYKAAFKDNEKVYAFERHLDKEKLLVLNNFFAEKVKIKLPENYLQGQVLLSNYKDVTLDETVTLQPYQTLAILVS